MELQTYIRLGITKDGKSFVETKGDINDFMTLGAKLAVWNKEEFKTILSIFEVYNKVLRKVI